MKDLLARRVLADLLGWDAEQLTMHSALLQTMAALKYDSYGQYMPGAKFAENLAVWLRQFDSDDDRAIALDFVEKDLLFVSERELHHIIQVAYPDLVERVHDRRVASRLGLPPWRVSELRSRVEYQAARRRTLYLGLSDGARLDRFRRASPQLSHEQFAQEYQVAPDVVEAMSGDLQGALDTIGASDPPSFEQVWLIDDFSGSGRTMVREDPDTGALKGKLPKFAQRLSDLVERGFVDETVTVDVLLYIASTQALQHVSEMLSSADRFEGWELHVVYQLPPSVKVSSSSPFGDLCERYYDEETTDTIKGRVPLGYDDCALPLVLPHNTPNNSASLLWAETGDHPALNRRALFPRYERHHQDRT